MSPALLLRSTVLAAALSVSGAHGENAAIAGELLLERPTLHALGFEWRVSGDANGDATGMVRYRPAGTAAWRDALPLMRLGLGHTKDNSMIARGWRYTIPDAIAGSIMDLEPGTAYEVELALKDPDGVAGEATRTLTLRTRAEPTLPAEPTEVRHVYPPGYQGEKLRPAYENIMHAVNGYPPICDTYQTIHPGAAKPGTVIRMHAGVHTYDNHLYWKDGQPQHSYWLHGIITLVASGTAERPIFIVGADDGEAIIDGANAAILLNVRSADYLHFEGLTIRNAGIAFFGGFQGERGGGNKGLTLKHCWIEDVVSGVLAQDGRSEDFTLTDNVLLGRNPAETWTRFGSTVGGYGVNLSGQGHHVGHNHVARFWDGLNVFTSALADPKDGQQARAIDFIGNDIQNCADQFLETDGGYANIRVLRNRMFNCPSQPISAQPVHAGPVYFIRNVLWNVFRGRNNFKEQSGAQAFVFLHNTTSAHLGIARTMTPPEKSTWWVRNNLNLGPLDEKQLARHLPNSVAARHISSHNAFRAGVPEGFWRRDDDRFTSLADLQTATGLEAGSILADYAVFTAAAEPPHTRNDTPFVFPAGVDLTLAEGSAAVDAGAVIPGANDGFTGRAPDLGAYERGQPPPPYGPRPGPYADKLAAMIDALTKAVAAKAPATP